MIRSLVRAAEIDPEAEFILQRNLAAEGLEQAFNGENLLWIDMVDPSDEEITWLEHQLKLHPAVVSDLKREDRRPNLLVYPEYIFLSLFQPQLRLNRVSGTEIHCIINERCFVTLRKADSNTVDNAYNRAAQNADSWNSGTSYFLYLTMQGVMDSYYPLIDRISNLLFELEEKTLSSGAAEDAQQSVYRVKQQLISLRQMIAPQREVLSNAIGEDRLVKTVENRDLFRHLYERLLRVYDVIDSQRDLSSNVLDLIQNQEASKLTDAVSRLTILSMIFLPLTFLIGLFGLNFVTTKPELVIPLPGVWVFTLLISATLVSGGILALFFRKRGWI